MDPSERADGVVVRKRDGTATDRRIALTFDDGPSDQTPTVLEVLAAAGARATFFLQGQAVAGREPIVRRTVAEGHELGNHLYSHPHVGDLSDEELREEITSTTEVIHRAGEAAPRLVRPPYGEDAGRVARVAEALGLGPTVLWSVDPGDWADTSAEEITGRVLASARPGAIVLLHDGRRDRSRTIEALPEMLAGLRRQGYRLVTVSELLGLEEGACS